MENQLSEAIADLEAFHRGDVSRDTYVRDVPPRRNADGSTTLGYPEYGEAMDALWAAFSAAGMNVSAEDYNDWLATKAPPLETLDQIAVLEREELLLRLFTIRRYERFCDGHWTAMLDRGVLLAFARRLAALNAELETRRSPAP